MIQNRRSSIVEIEIRSARASDSTEVMEVLRNTSSPTFLKYSILRAPSSEKYVEECLGSSESKWKIFIAEAGGKIAGTYFAQSLPEGWFLNYLSVSAWFEGMGIGKKMLDHFEREGQKICAARAMLDVFESNDRAMGLYNARGYKKLRSAYCLSIPIARNKTAKYWDYEMDPSAFEAAIEEEKKMGFSNVKMAIAGGGEAILGLIAGDAVRLLSWQGAAIEAVIDRVIDRFESSRKELLILGLDKIPGDYRATIDKSWRLYKDLPPCE